MARRFFGLAHRVNFRVNQCVAAASYEPKFVMLAIATLYSYIVCQFHCTSVFASSGMTHAEHFEFTPPSSLEAGLAF